MANEKQGQAGGGRSLYTMDFVVVAVLAIGVVWWLKSVNAPPPPLPPGPDPAQVASSQAANPGSRSPAALTPEAALPVQTNPHQEGLVFKTDEHELKLNTTGATVDALAFKHIKETTYRPVQDADDRVAADFEVLRPFVPEVRTLGLWLVPDSGSSAEDLATATLDWAHEVLPGDVHRFTLTLPSGLVLTKTYSPPAGAAGDDKKAPQLYHFEVAVRAENRGQQALPFRYRMAGPAGIVDQTASGRAAAPAMVGWGIRDDRQRVVNTLTAVTALEEKPPVAQGTIAWFGLTTKYFAALVVPTQAPTVNVEGRTLRSFTKEPLETDHGKELAKEGVARVLVGDGAPPLRPGEFREDRYVVYVGPKQKSVFLTEGTPYSGLNLDKLVDFGWFEFFARILLQILAVFHAVVRNYGVSIILLTFLVRGLLLPVSIWSQKNMLRMQKLTPELNKVKEKYQKKDGTMTPENQRAFSMAQMELMRKHQVNPVGCIGPIFLQIPVFVGLWNALNYSFELRGEPFALWIHDLSTPDVLLRLPFTLPMIGTNAFSLLPLVMSCTYFLQQHLQPVSTDPKAAEQQKMMKVMLPFFGLLLYTMPSGLMIYFITSSLWGIVEQRWVKKKLELSEGKLPPTAAAMPAS